MFVAQETLSSVPYSEVISTRKVRAESGTLYLELKCGNLFQQRVARLQTDQAHEITRLIRQYMSLHRREYPQQTLFWVNKPNPTSTLAARPELFTAAANNRPSLRKILQISRGHCLPLQNGCCKCCGARSSHRAVADAARSPTMG